MKLSQIMIKSVDKWLLYNSNIDEKEKSLCSIESTFKALFNISWEVLFYFNIDLALPLNKQ